MCTECAPQWVAHKTKHVHIILDPILAVTGDKIKKRRHKVRIGKNGAKIPICHMAMARCYCPSSGLIIMVEVWQ